MCLPCFYYLTIYQIFAIFQGMTQLPLPALFPFYFRAAGGKHRQYFRRRSLVGMGAAWMLAGNPLLAGDASQLWEVAKPTVVVPGAPRHSDVSMRSLRPHPAKPGDPRDTLATAQEFHLTRLEWTYEMDAAFVKKAKALGLTVGGALEDESSDASGSKEFGRVTGQDGKLKKHKWFPEGRWVGCANAPEFMEATLYQARKQVDAGIDVMQQDDPSMAVHCVPPYCYCDYCKTAYVEYQKTHGQNASYDQFQKDSIVAFHKEMHRRLDAYAGRHIPFSNNTGIVRYGTLGWAASAFDYVLAEIDAPDVQPARLCKVIPAAQGVPLSFQFRDPSEQEERRGLAIFYALGTTMLMPWDVYLNNSNRYFGSPVEYADLSGFIRANATYLDNYEDAAAAGPGIKETRYGAGRPIEIKGGSGQVFCLGPRLVRSHQCAGGGSSGGMGPGRPAFHAAFADGEFFRRARSQSQFAHASAL